MTANMQNSPVMAANMRNSSVIKDDRYMSHIGHRAKSVDVFNNLRLEVFLRE